MDVSRTCAQEAPPRTTRARGRGRGRLERELAKAIVGQQRVIREILIAFLAGGHCLLRGVPGLAKTLLIKKLAEAVDLQVQPHPVHARPDAVRHPRRRGDRGGPHHRASA